MIRYLLALLLLIGAPGHAAPPGPRDWTQVIVATPLGGLRMGNPNAPVKLLEFASLSCHVCRAFHDEGQAALTATYVRGGRVSYEYRPFLLSGVDFAPSLLVRCQPPAIAWKLIDAFYAQPAWLDRFGKLTPADQARLAGLTPQAQIKELALIGGVDGFVRARGIPRARFDQCLANQAGIDTLAAIRDDAVKNYGLLGTPTFAINGTTLKNVSSWAALQPQLDAALR